MMAGYFILSETRSESVRETGESDFPEGKVARPSGVEPETSWSVARHSIQLSYGRYRKFDSTHGAGRLIKSFLVGLPVECPIIVGILNLKTAILQRHAILDTQVRRNETH